MDVIKKIERMLNESNINEEYPIEVKKDISSSTLQNMGRTLSKNGFDVQRTNFGKPVTGLSNRDKRLKDPNYAVIILYALSEQYKEIYCLINNKVMYGNEYNFSKLNWTKIVTNSLIWFIEKKDIVSTVDLRALREKQKDGALALQLEKTRQEFDKEMARYVKNIKQAYDTLATIEKNKDKYNQPQNEIDRVKKDLKNEQEWLASYLTHKNPLGEWNNNLDKYQKKLADIKKNTKANEFDTLEKTGELIDKVQAWLLKKNVENIAFFKKSFQAKDPEKYHPINPEATKFENECSKINDVMRILYRFLQEGALSDNAKSDLIKLIS